jgi:dATP pyrophosphohydrolase
VKLAELWSGDFCEQFYEANKDRIMMLPVFIGVVPPDAEVVLNAEHDGYKWLGYEEADRLLAFPGQRKMLAAVKAGFIDRQPHTLLRIPIG